MKKGEKVVLKETLDNLDKLAYKYNFEKDLLYDDIVVDINTLLEI